jgi:hypothetical protein
MNQENVQENQEDSVDFNAVLVPHIEEGIPIPKNSHEALPSMNNEEEVVVRATTIKELSDLTGQQIAPDAKHRLDAEEIARDMITNPKKKQEFAKYANETMAFLGGMVGTYNHMIVNDLADLKLYVVNKLVEIVQDEESNIKEQITALRSIGEVDGVDAFKKKTEVVHKMETMEEVEKELLNMLSELKQKALIKPKSDIIDAEIVEDDRDETENNDN